LTIRIPAAPFNGDTAHGRHTHTTRLNLPFY
jgi:hypothetical protein